MMGREGRAVSDAARELGCDGVRSTRSHPLLDADEGWIGAVEAVVVDETMFLRTAPWRRPEKRWCTSIVDVEAGQLLDIVPGRSAAGPARWLNRAGFTGITTESDTGEEQDNVPVSGTPSPSASGPAHAYTFHTTDTFRL